jgi:hypothetical protein
MYATLISKEHEKVERKDGAPLQQRRNVPPGEDGTDDKVVQKCPHHVLSVHICE